MPLPNGLFRELRDSRAANQRRQPEPPIRGANQSQQPGHFTCLLVLLLLIFFLYFYTILYIKELLDSS